MKKGGMPIYLDIDRKLLDTADVDETQHDWHPGNSAAHKLYRCVECLRDVEGLLEGGSHLENATKKRRKAKAILTPLYSLAECTVDLLNDCESNPDTVRKLQGNVTKLISQLRLLLLQHIPIGKGGLLLRLRNKTSAHIDKTLSPAEVHKLIGALELHEIGMWLHTSISVLCDLLKLPIYFWTCESKYPDVTRLLACEPFLVSFRCNKGEIVELIAVHMVKRPPRADIRDLMLEVVDRSKWLFRPTDTQIRGFYEDDNTDFWARSLKTFPIKR